MPDNFEIRENGALVIIINEVEYEFKEKDDFIYSDNKKIILKYHAIINLAANANIKVGPPVLLSNHDSGCFVFYREAILSDGTKFYAVGEANDVKDNLWSEYLQQYPAETADSRAYERAGLGAVGVYGKIYDGSEIPFEDGVKDEKTHVATKTAVKKDDAEAVAEETDEGESDTSAVTRRICRNGGTYRYLSLYG